MVDDNSQNFATVRFSYETVSFLNTYSSVNIRSLGNSAYFTNLSCIVKCKLLVWTRVTSGKVSGP